MVGGCGVAPASYGDMYGCKEETSTPRTRREVARSKQAGGRRRSRATPGKARDEQGECGKM